MKGLAAMAKDVDLKIVKGTTYQTWSGDMKTVENVNTETVRWRDQNGETGLTRLDGFTAQVRRPVEDTPKKKSIEA